MAKWDEVFGGGIGNLTLSRVDATSAIDGIDILLSETFALLGSSVLEHWSVTDGWPNHANGDIGTAFIISDRSTALVVCDQDKAAIVLFSGLAKRLTEFAALYCLDYDQGTDADALEVYEGLLKDGFPTLAEIWIEYGLDEARWPLAHNMFLQMLEYVVQHELAHVDRGHVGRASSGASLTYLSESQALEAHRSGDKGARNREFEADVWAVQLLLEERLKTDLSTQPPAAVLAHLRVTVSAWIMVLMALDKEAEPLERWALSTHPAPVHRAMMIDEAFLDGIRNAFGYDQDEIREFLDDVWVTTSQVAERAKSIEGRWWGESTQLMGRDEFATVFEEFCQYFSDQPTPARFSDASIS